MLFFLTVKSNISGTTDKTQGVNRLVDAFYAAVKKGATFILASANKPAEDSGQVKRERKINIGFGPLNRRNYNNNNCTGRI